MIEQIFIQNVLNALKKEPSIDAAHIDVVAGHDEVILNGQVKYYAEKLSAGLVAKEILGATAITNSLVVHPIDDPRLTDADIAYHARNVLAWDALVPHSAISLIVEKGWMTLSGQVEWEFQKQSTEASINNLIGITGVTNGILVMATTQTSNLSEEIKAAFDKNSQVADGDIEVSIEGNKVTLRGEVGSHYSRALAENVARYTEGVSHVEDLLTVG